MYPSQTPTPMVRPGMWLLYRLCEDMGSFQESLPESGKGVVEAGGVTGKVGGVPYHHLTHPVLDCPSLLCSNGVSLSVAQTLPSAYPPVFWDSLDCPTSESSHSTGIHTSKTPSHSQASDLKSFLCLVMPGPWLTIDSSQAGT